MGEMIGFTFLKVTLAAAWKTDWKEERLEADQLGSYYTLK